MSDLPEGWAHVPLEIVGTWGSGGTPTRTNDQYYAKEGIPWLVIGDLNDRVVLKSSNFITELGLINSSAKLVPAGTLLVAMYGSIGKLGITGIECATNQAIAFCKPNESIVSLRYLYRAMFNAKPNLLALGQGGAQQNISQSVLKEFKILLAPKNEQARIANQLDTLLTRIQSCNDRFDAIPALLKRFRQTVLDAATTGQLTDDWRMDKSGQVIAEEVVAARLAVAGTRPTKASAEFFANHQPVTPLKGVLPEPWLFTHIGMVGVVSNGSTPSRKEPSYWGGAIPWVSSGEVANGVIHRTREKITEEGFNNESVRLLPKGTVLMAMIGEGKTRGQSAILDIDACINQNIAGVVPVEGILDSKYLWFWFRREYENTRTKGNGSGPKALNCERVRELEVNLPPLAEQAEIVRRVEALFTLADRIEVRANAARTHAQRLSPLVLAKAFRGELVPQDPQDEPANELLNRIVAAQSITPKKHVVKAATRRTPKVKPQDVSTSLSGDEPLEAIMKLDLVPDNYLETLVSAAECVSAKGLWQKSKLGIDDFYAQLSKEIDRGLLEVDAQDETRICRSATSQRGRA
jgi:type I restriction enzyme S subunit